MPERWTWELEAHVMDLLSKADERPWKWGRELGSGDDALIAANGEPVIQGNHGHAFARGRENEELVERGPELLDAAIQEIRRLVKELDEYQTEILRLYRRLEDRGG